MSAVQNLKSRCAAVATPIASTGFSTPRHDTCTVKPTSSSSAFVYNGNLTTPVKAAAVLQTTPQHNLKNSLNVTPKNGVGLSTPRTPISSQLSVCFSKFLLNWGINHQESISLQIVFVGYA